VERKMEQPTVGFIVYGVHKDGLKDPMGVPFIDDELVKKSKEALKKQGLKLVELDIVVASKQEARDAFRSMKQNEDISSVVLFSGTWVWAAHMTAAIQDYVRTGKGVLIWTHDGSQGWRPVGGLVLHGSLNEIGVKHRFVYGSADDPATVSRILSYAHAAHMKDWLNFSTIGAFGGRGMGQSCGVADASQWMREFGVDIDTRDNTQLIKIANEVTQDEIDPVLLRIKDLFVEEPPKDDVSERSIRLYIAIKKYIEREKWDWYTIQSFPGLGDDYSATCFAQSMMLNDRWGTSTIGDFNTAFSTLLMQKLGNEPVYYGDLQHIDKKNKEVKIIGDGTCPPSLASKVGPAKFAEHGIPTEGEAGGLSIDLVCKAGKGCLSRINRVNGNFEMVIVPVEIYEPSPEEIEKRRLECNIPFWPHAFVKFECDPEILIKHWNNEYGVLGYGEHLPDYLEAFCEIADIKYIRA
jgi:L-arabinose isomerase